MSKTGIELAHYAQSKIGTPYFYGAKMNVLTEKYMYQMHNMYPSVVTVSYIDRAIRQNQVGFVNTDCSGLIYGYRKRNLGSSQLYSTAKRRMPISEVDKFAIGTVLWKKGHVGVYIGNGQVVEAKGIKYGTIVSKVSDTKWEYGLTFDDIEYTYAESVDGTAKGKNPYVEPDLIVTSKMQALLKKVNVYSNSGIGVKWVQWELNEAGYNLEIDGKCGPKTLAAIKDLQKNCGLKIDGLCGRETRKALKAG